MGNKQQCVVKGQTQRSRKVEQLRQTWESESHWHRMFSAARKAETENRALCRAMTKVTNS